MNDRSAGLWVVLLVALAGVLHVAPIGTQTGGQSEKRPSAAATQPEPDEPKNGPEQSLIEELEKFYPVDPKKDVSCGEYFGTARQSSGKAGKSECAVVDSFKKSKSLAVIALVPDPLDSHTAYRFDETLEALQTGAQQAGYLFDRFALTWPRPGSNTSSDKKDSKAAADFRTMPSFLLFRSRTDTDRILVMFLVGETPTAGIHKTAMVRALQLSRALLADQAKSGGSSRLRVIGPNFSGSVDSLRRAVEQWCPEEKVTLHFVSENSTSLGARTSLNQTACGGVDVQFHGTVLHDDVLETALYSYLTDDIGVAPENIAVLTESDSSYGQTFIHQEDKTKKEGESKQKSETKPRFAYVLPYPMQISQVRTLQVKDSQPDDQAISVMENPSHAVLHLAMDDAADPKDKPPVFSPGPMANLAELSLSNIIHTLNRESIRYVGLFGTDTRDKLFLARLIRSYHPDIQFFTNDSEILFAHPSYTADLWGMIIASTYPLVPQSQTWIRDTAHPQIIRQFSSQSAASAHNAASIAIGRENLGNRPGVYNEEHRLKQDPLMVQSDESVEMVDYINPFAPGQKLPVAWITAVGNESLWPISLYDPWNDSGADPPVPSALNIQHSRTFTVLLLVLSVFCIVNCCQYLYTRRKWRSSKDIARQYRMFEPVISKATEHQSRWQRVGIFFFFLLQLVFYAAITSIVLMPPTTTTGSFERILALATLCVLLFTVLKSIPSTLPSEGNNAYIYLLQAVVGIGSVVVFVVLGWPTSQPYHIMLYERATHLGSGISPILPVLFLSIALGAGLVCFLRRMQLSIYIDNVNPYSKIGDDPFRKLFCNISDAMRPVYWPTPTVATTLVGLSATVIGWTLWRRFFVTIESEYYDWGLFGMFAILIACLFWAAFHFLTIWYHMRRLLRQFASQRLSAAFVRLPARLSRGLSTNLLDSPPTLLNMEEPLETLAAIRHEFAAVKRSELTLEQSACLPNLDKMVTDINNTLSRERSNALDREIPLQALSSNTQKALCAASRKLFTALWSYWDRNPFHDRPKPERDAIAKGFKLSENFVASQTVAHFNCVFMTLRYLFACTGSGVLFLLLATSSYPFRMQNLMMNFAWALLLLFAAVHLTMFLQMDRSPVLRAIANQQDKGALNRAVVGQAIVFGVIPVMMFLASKFPTLGRILSAWVSPALKAIKFQ